MCYQKNDNSKDEIYTKKHTIKEIVEKFFVPYTQSNRRNLYLKDKHFHAVNNIRKCRTKELGYTLYACKDCGEAHFIYRSCGHRFCPTCGIINTNKWAEKTLSNLLDIKHHHVVVTLPAWLRPIAKRNNKLIYSILFRSAWLVIKDWFAYKYQIEPGVISVLHTAGSDLKYHPHVHMIVTGGGLTLGDKDGAVKLLEGDFLFSQEWFSKRFRWEFQQLLIKAFTAKAENKLRLPYHLQKRSYFLSFISKNNKRDKKGWIASVQAPLQDATSIVKYVGRYTKRACLSEYKIQSIEGEFISFNYNDYKNTAKGEKTKISTIRLHYAAFLDRLLLHVPDKGSRHVRYYGIYSTSKINKLPKEYQATAQRTVNNEENEPDLLNIEGDWESYQIEYYKIYGKDPLWCEHCNRPLTYVETVLPFHRKQLDNERSQQTMKEVREKSAKSRNKAMMFDDDS